MKPTDSATACGARDVNADVIARTPETIETATVIT